MNIKKLLIVYLVLILIGFTIGFSLPVHAQQLSQQPLCSTYSELLVKLKKTYDEVPIGFGIANNGALIQFFSSNEGKTWTILINFPNSDKACLIVAGHDWEFFLRKKGKGT